MDIIFVRHGKTKANEDGILAGASDVSLSRNGVMEAQEAAVRIKGITMDHVYSSPLKRAGHTAELLGLNCSYDHRLKEMNFGIFEGMTYKTMVEKHPEETSAWASDYVNYKIPGGESLKEVYERTSSFLSEIEQVQGKILVVTHESVIKCALCTVLGSLEHFYRFRADHCRFTQIAFENDYRYIKTLNSERIY